MRREQRVEMRGCPAATPNRLPGEGEAIGSRNCTGVPTMAAIGLKTAVRSADSSPDEERIKDHVRLKCVDIFFSSSVPFAGEDGHYAVKFLVYILKYYNIIYIFAS